ncbi:DsrE/DsrF/DrsH-like family protein [Thiosulfativibrio zosterae]|uniref:NADH dehydrogenase n=1 Tax=Thiosulfativibrio zosterae TaxID=2675053 RepID=A0A6F8PLJ0_9GAMM|nr:DsrE/DsrF/DrsH-like family protein [Thiosulfativibrio zosterae]BBP42955.1 NADH dehydrogenase [Thiosulfativibrio zosterae]
MTSTNLGSNISSSEALTPQFSIIVSKGTLDALYPALILASSASAMGKQVELFFTFYGLKCLLKDTRSIKVTPLGNPAMEIKCPIGPKWLKKIDFNHVFPPLIWTLPGMTSLATWGFKKKMQSQNQLSLEALRDLCVSMDIKMTACQMSVDLLGYQENEFIEGIEFAGAATYFASSADNQALYI